MSAQPAACPLGMGTVRARAVTKRKPLNDPRSCGVTRRLRTWGCPLHLGSCRFGSACGNMSRSTWRLSPLIVDRTLITCSKDAGLGILGVGVLGIGVGTCSVHLWAGKGVAVWANWGWCLVICAGDFRNTNKQVFWAWTRSSCTTAVYNFLYYTGTTGLWLLSVTIYDAMAVHLSYNLF